MEMWLTEQGKDHLYLAIVEGYDKATIEISLVPIDNVHISSHLISENHNPEMSHLVDDAIVKANCKRSPTGWIKD